MVRRYYKKRARKPQRRYKRRMRVIKRAKPRRGPASTNPQFLRVRRKFDYLVPSADLSRGTYGCYAYLAAGTASATLNSYTAAFYDFRISDIPSVTEFGSLFDQYKIYKVVLNFQYLTSTNSVQYPNLGVVANPQNSVCTVCVLNDYDDSTAPGATNAGWAAIQETGRAKYHTFPNPKRGNSFRYTVYPKVLQAVFNTAGTAVAGSVKSSGWQDGALTPDVVFRGVKVLVQVPPADTEFQSIVHTFKCTATYYTAWRQRQ